jgi:hypothetical protein
VADDRPALKWRTTMLRILVLSILAPVLMFTAIAVAVAKDKGAAPEKPIAPVRMVVLDFYGESVVLGLYRWADSCWAVTNRGSATPVPAATCDTTPER